MEHHFSLTLKDFLRITGGAEPDAERYQFGSLFGSRGAWVILKVKSNDVMYVENLNLQVGSVKVDLSSLPLGWEIVDIKRGAGEGLA